MSPVTRRRAGHSHHTATHARSSYSWEVGKRTPSTPPAPGRPHRKAARGPDRICPAHPVGQATERTPSTAEISTAPRPHPSHGHAHAFFLPRPRPFPGPAALCLLLRSLGSGHTGQPPVAPEYHPISPVPTSAACGGHPYPAPHSEPTTLGGKAMGRVSPPSTPVTSPGAQEPLAHLLLLPLPQAYRLPRDLPIGERDRDPKGPSAPWRWLCPPPLGTSGARWS